MPDNVVNNPHLHVLLDGILALALEALSLVAVRNDFAHLPLQSQDALTGFHLLLQPLRDLNHVWVVEVFLVILQLPLRFLELLKFVWLDGGKYSVDEVYVLQNQTILHFSCAVKALRHVLEHIEKHADHRLEELGAEKLVLRSSHLSFLSSEDEGLSAKRNARHVISWAVLLLRHQTAFPTTPTLR